MDMYSTSLTDLKEQMLQGLKLMITSHFSMVYDDMVRRIESNLKYRETKLLQQQQQELKGQVSNLMGICIQKLNGGAVLKML